MDIFVALAKACDGPWDLVVMLLVTLGTSPLLLLIGSMSGDLTASRMLFSVTRSSWIVSSFSICSLLIYRLERASGLEQLGLSVAPLSEADAYVSTIAISMFAAVILADIVLIILWPEMLRTNRSVVAGATINCIACSACMLKLSGPELFCDDFTGRKLSIGRYIVWNHTIALMCVLLNNLTTVSNQQACWRVFLSQMVIQAGFAGSVAMGSIPLNCAFLAISQYALTRVCVLLFHSLREAKSFAWQRSILGIFVFTTWHCFPIIWVFVALDFVDASGEFRLYAIADVLSKTLITTTMLQGHVKVESDKLVSEFNVVTAERKMMQDDLYELIHSAAVPIIVTNAKGQVTVWNRVVAETSHIPPHAAEGCAMWELPHLTPSAAAGAKAALSQILAETDSESEPCASITFELTFQARGDSINSDNESDSARSEPQPVDMSTLATGFKSRHDGSRAAATLLLVTASVTRDGTGTTSGLVCLCADMTAECERLMAEASRAQVEAINDAKDKFLACMSHEMRTPLSALIGLLQLVVAKSASEWSHQVLSPFVTSSLKSAEHLYVLVSDVLDMSKVQHGKLSLNIREFDLRETMESVAGRCRHVLSAVESSKRHVDLVVNIAPTELRVLTGDAQRIQQIITNLGTNAIKYTMHGHVTIDVNLRPLSPTECEGCEPNLWNEAAEYLPRCCSPVELSVSVSDTGIGIPKNALKRIFDLFETVTGDAALANPSLGISSASGIGLTICKELVNAMGGSLSVQSAVGTGSTFVFRLQTLSFYDGPMAPNSSALQTSRDDTFLHAPSAGDLPSEAPGRLMLVEDDEMNRVVISMFLEGHEIAEAYNGLEAVVAAYRELKSSGGVDVIIMDINMPMLTGRQACQLIRLMQFGVNPWATRLPIIALTANAMDSELRKCIDAGMTACLTKPVPHQALVDIVANSLRHCRQAEYRPSADELVACTDQLAQIESSLPLLREFSTLVIAALQHSVGVREDFEARTGALLGCLAWALKLIGSYAAQREIERFLQREAGAPELQLAEAARELLDEHAQAWLEQFSNVPARLDSRRDQRNGAHRLSADRLLAELEGDY